MSAQQLQRVLGIHRKADVLAGCDIERKNLGIDHSALKLFMAHKPLDDLRVHIAIQQMHRKTVAERVRADGNTEPDPVTAGGIDGSDQPVSHGPVGHRPDRPRDVRR